MVLTSVDPLLTLEQKTVDSLSGYTADIQAHWVQMQVYRYTAIKGKHAMFVKMFDLAFYLESDSAALPSLKSRLHLIAFVNTT